VAANQSPDEYAFPDAATKLKLPRLMESEDDILAWLVAAVAKETKRDPAHIDADKSVHTLGIDSALVISLTFDLEDRFGVQLDPTVLFQQASLRAFARLLAEHLAGKGANS
jgi:acyl carrier protein